MKIAGREVSGPNIVYLVLPRTPEIDEDGNEISRDIIIKAEAVSDLSVMDDLLQEPKPPAAMGKGGETVYNYKDTTYKQQMLQYNLKKLAYIVIKSLEPSEIEWDEVDLEDPNTWLRYVDEFKAAGLSQIEINKIGQAVMEANALDEAKLDKARADFLRGRAAVPKSFSGQNTPAPSS